MVEQHTTLSTRQNLLEAKKIISRKIIPFKKAKLFNIEDELLTTEKSFLTQITTNSDEDYHELFTNSKDTNNQDNDDGENYVAGDEVSRDVIVNAASSINAANSFTNDDDLSSDLVVASDELMKGSDEAVAKNILENINKEALPELEIMLTPYHRTNYGTTVVTKVPEIIMICIACYGLEAIKKERMCVVCPRNTYSGSIHSFCKMCPEGKYQPDPGSTLYINYNSPVDASVCLRMLLNLKLCIEIRLYSNSMSEPV
ncbi:uncharacterized protein [Euwallacea fornicatus]|uniref:uncharacterized protein n=1 Tax=Euwallacea fornicatus TaxID=995702 RepID=UPI00338F136C